MRQLFLTFMKVAKNFYKQSFIIRHKNCFYTANVFFKFMEVGLYFGSFNPVHIGHMAIANYMVEYTDLQQIWFVVSPQNPLKAKNTLLADYQRYELVSRAIGNNIKFRVSSIEFSMPKPSYTIDTLTYISEKYPNHKFSIIMGSDNILTLNKWKNYEQILKYYKIFIYPRSDFQLENLEIKGNFEIANAPQMEISSSFIRQAIKEGKDIPYFMPSEAYKYMREMHFYENK